MKVVAIIQARMGSKRFPGKVMTPIFGIPVIELLLKRLALAKKIDQIVVATVEDPTSQPLVDCVNALGFPCMQGSERNVMVRFLQTAENCNADIIVRITGDCPLVDPVLVDECIKGFFDSGVDYFSNIQPPSYPDGLDVEVFTYEALLKSSKKTNCPFDQEHVTSFLIRSPLFSKATQNYHTDLSNIRLTLDYQEDLHVISNIFGHFSPNIHFGFEEIISLKNKDPDLFLFNTKYSRNEGAQMSDGQKLWKRAKDIIPGGTMLLSKRPELFLPEFWPTYYNKAKGCKIWDLDGNEYFDVSIMGIGTNILGYGREEVDEAVSFAIKRGNMSTLNCPEEVLLAEKLVELHPWSEMVRFARSGGEANAIAIRIARAASGRDKVAICGYHGWHDWYLSANLGDEKSLDGHLLPGLQPNGVPRSLKGTVFSFEYNNFDELLELVNREQIGVIKMEVLRNKEPENDFLSKVRNLANEKGIVLIFDECTSGFRETFGGLHKKYGVEPDIAMFGKALGNGYAITAIIGRGCVMEAAQSSFISSTFWTERIGPTAALKTLEIMEQLKSWQIITSIGKEFRKSLCQLADQYEVSIKTHGLKALTSFEINSKNHLAYKTLISQEMLSQGFIASTSFYPCIDHTADILDSYFAKLDRVFSLIAECERGRDVHELLKGPVCHGGFKRLN